MPVVNIPNPAISLPIAFVNSVEFKGYLLPITDDDWSDTSYPNEFHRIVSRSDGVHTQPKIMEITIANVFNGHIITLCCDIALPGQRAILVSRRPDSKLSWVAFPVGI
jgi:hypothetical protein